MDVLIVSSNQFELAVRKLFFWHDYLLYSHLLHSLS